MKRPDWFLIFLSCRVSEQTEKFDLDYSFNRTERNVKLFLFRSHVLTITSYSIISFMSSEFFEQNFLLFNYWEFFYIHGDSNLRLPNIPNIPGRYKERVLLKMMYHYKQSTFCFVYESNNKYQISKPFFKQINTFDYIKQKLSVVL